MKRLLIITGVATAAALAVAGCRGGFGHCGHHGMHGHHKMNPEKVSSRIASKLDMDKDQKVKLDALVKKTFDQMPEMHKKHGAMIDELIKQFEADAFDPTAINKLLTEAEVDMKKAKEVILASTAEFHAMLKPEQKTKIVDKLKKYQKRIADRPANK